MDAAAYRAHYEAVGEGMIQGHVQDHTPRWQMPAVLLARATRHLYRPLMVLDLGCGDGDIARRFTALPWVAGVTLVDVALPTVAKAHEWYGLPGVAAWAEHLPFRTGQFDACLLIGVLEHVLDPGPVLAEAERVADWVAAVVPMAGDKDPDHLRLFPLGEWAATRGEPAWADGREVFAVWESGRDA